MVRVPKRFVFFYKGFVKVFAFCLAMVYAHVSYCHPPSSPQNIIKERQEVDIRVCRLIDVGWVLPQFAGKSARSFPELPQRLCIYAI